MATLVFDWLDNQGEQNDEVCSIFLDGQLIIRANHDDHAWDGMTGIIDALTAVAHQQGWTIEVRGESGV